MTRYVLHVEGRRLPPVDDIEPLRAKILDALSQGGAFVDFGTIEVLIGPGSAVAIERLPGSDEAEAEAVGAGASSPGVPLVSSFDDFDEWGL